MQSDASRLRFQSWQRATDREVESSISTVTLPESNYQALTDRRAVASARRILFKAAREVSAATLIVDLAKVNCVGGEFVGLLAKTAGLLRERQRRLVVRATSQPCAVLELCRLDKLQNVELRLILDNGYGGRSAR